MDERSAMDWLFAPVRQLAIAMLARSRRITRAINEFLTSPLDAMRDHAQYGTPYIPVTFVSTHLCQILSRTTPSLLRYPTTHMSTLSTQSDGSGQLTLLSAKAHGSRGTLALFSVQAARRRHIRFGKSRCKHHPKPGR